jgi:beta-lactamase family protein
MVAVDDLTTGTEASYGGTRTFITASIVKVDILCTLLYRSQESHRALTSEEERLATTMIENSDNDSATSLYGDAGGAAGVDRANRVFGLRETSAGAGQYWGLTTTTVDDQIRLLRLVLTRPSVLTARSQDYIQHLMSHVEADQQWGVPAAADHRTPFLVKNGWLPSPATGQWEINSIGEVIHDHQHLLIAVLSDDNASEASGISVVEEIARKAAGALAR